MLNAEVCKLLKRDVRARSHIKLAAQVAGQFKSLRLLGGRLRFRRGLGLGESVVFP